MDEESEVQITETNELSSDDLQTSLELAGKLAASGKIAWKDIVTEGSKIAQMSKAEILKIQEDLTATSNKEAPKGFRAQSTAGGGGGNANMQLLKQAEDMKLEDVLKLGFDLGAFDNQYIRKSKTYRE